VRKEIQMERETIAFDELCISSREAEKYTGSERVSQVAKYL
jgi:hypothetical protein